MIRTLLAASALALTAPFAFAQSMPMADEVPAHIGPAVGDTFPDFAAVSSDGTPVTLAELSAANGVVMVFSRSLDWCPFCQAQSIDLKDAETPLSGMGWNLNLITYDAPDVLAAYGVEHEIPYELLSDTGSAMIDEFGLRNTEVPAGSRYDGIPHPAIIFLSPEGEVLSMLREEGFQTRPPVELILETAHTLAEQES
ncbi:peroxiredoxin family protein [Ponticaulis sp.]|uniref:peroxiredoxin family protein n=1 Tax=Ponticaulis sp. TaxID=2020902 RepID=UPI000B6A534A|nr:peroxiredoxin family protein [Ponticaulis sp.]MAI91655.1 alkyl hydroperoxide reductase [Ponticaulis sp.]OUX97220.1 MAG: hypothetical protein CBB65_14535 [Hyphomonadaceae bacterium TMED5]|tara:strand:+ start:48432 stop:49022 length:591 start_codon:yes stop_codon:yes gene_type:complete